MHSLFENHFSQRQRLQVILYALLYGVLLGGAVAFFSPVLPFQDLDSKLYQAWARQRVQTVGSSDVAEAVDQLVIVEIDDQSLSSLSWPLPRGLYAEIIRRLEKAGATTIGLDILFLDPGPDPAQDRSLKEALARPTVVVPYVLEAGNDRLIPQYPHPSLLEGWEEEWYDKKLGFTADWSQANRRTVPLAVVDRPTDLAGNPLLVDGKPIEEHYYALATTMYAHHREIPPDQGLNHLKLEPELVRFRELDIAAQGITVNFAALGFQESRFIDVAEMEGQDFVMHVQEGAGTGRVTLAQMLPVISLQDLLSVPDEELPGFFGLGDRFMAIVGVTARAGYDQKISLVGPISGVELQANVLLNLMLGNPLKEVSDKTQGGMVLGTALLVGVVGAFLSYQGSGIFTTLLLLILFAANWWGYAGGDFKAGGLLLPFFGPATAAILTQIAVSIYYHQTDKARMEKIIKMFREVCPVHDLEGLLEGQGLQLGGEERELSILFSDLRGYTSFAEKLDSVTVLNTLNQYFGTVGHILERYGGLVFDYQGDAQMVVFGLLKESQPNHAAAACKAGAEMIATLNAMRIQWLEAGQNVPETGVGICTGPVSFGVLGTQQHKQYVAIGDPTNTAARVQGKSAELDAPVLVAGSTAKRAGDAVILEEIDEIYLKGKKEPLLVYRVCIDEMLQRGIVEVRDIPRRGSDAP